MRSSRDSVRECKAPPARDDNDICSAARRCSPPLSSSRKRGPICGRPPSRKRLSAGFDRIGCDHMSGLFLRSQLTAGPDGFRDARSKQRGGFGRHWVLRSVTHRRFDRSHQLLLLEQASPASTGACAPVESIMRRRLPVARGAQRSPHEAKRSAPRAAPQAPADGRDCNARHRP